MRSTRNPIVSVASLALFSAAMLAVSCGFARAQTVELVYHDIHPANGGSTQDTFYALLPSNCGLPTMHPDFPPVVTRSAPTEGTVGVVEGIDIEYFLVGPGDVVCPAVVTPDTLIPIEIGHLSKGTTMVMQRFTLVDEDGDPIGSPLQQSWVHFATVGDTPNPAISGTWFDPSAPGVGVSLSLAPDPGHEEPTAVLFLATLTDEGEPLWLTGSGKFVDATLEVALTRSSDDDRDGTVETAPAGTATFEYLGCDSAQLSIDGVEVRFPADDDALRQLTHTFGLPGCRPPTTRAFGS